MASQQSHMRSAAPNLLVFAQTRNFIPVLRFNNRLVRTCTVLALLLVSLRLETYSAIAQKATPSRLASATTRVAGSGSDVVEIMAIAAGGSAVANATGGDASFVADEDFKGGGLASSVTTKINLAQPGANAAPMPVYQHGRVGAFTYTLPGLTAGKTYTVLLHFAENYWGAAGKRVFNVAINGTQVLANFDIFANVGKNAALVQGFDATANNNGQIVVSFTKATEDQPILMGIELRAGSAAAACNTVPAAPANVTALATSNTSISLSWGAVTPPAGCTVTGYNVFGSTVSGFTPSAATQLATNVLGTNYTNTGLNTSTPYFYVVEAIDAFGSSNPSVQVGATTADPGSSTTVATPISTPAAGTYTSTQNVTLTSATAGATIHYTTDGSTPTATSAVYAAPIVVDSSETIRAFATENGSLSSAVASASYTINSASGFVEAPTHLTAVASTSQQTYVNWAPSATPKVNYLVFRDTDPSFIPGTSNLVCTYSQSVNLAAATGADPHQVCTTWSMTYLADNNAGAELQPSTTYYYRVEAMNASGAVSAPTNAVAVTTLGASTSGIPAAIADLNATAESPDEIALTWSSSTANSSEAVVITYNVYRSTTSSFTPSSGNLVGTTKANFFQDDLVAANTTYYYIVRASNPSGTSAVSPIASATTDALGNAPPFWDMTNIPTAKNVLELKLLNRTNGKYTDDQITWGATINGVKTQNTLAQQPYFDMPANPSGRMYFYLGPVGQGATDYYDFIEFTVGSASINFDTTRVDALGIKLSARLSCGDGTDVVVGENQQTFAEDRAATFARYLNEVTPAFQPEAQKPYTPYRIVQPGTTGFKKGGLEENYYADYVSQIWSENGLTFPLAGPNGSGLGSHPSLSAAIFRHTAAPGTFNPDGSLKLQGIWGNPATFFQQEPYNHYAQFMSSMAVNGLQYGFPYNDAGGYSSDVSCKNPKTLVIAIGW